MTYLVDVAVITRGAPGAAGVPGSSSSDGRSPTAAPGLGPLSSGLGLGAAGAPGSSSSDGRSPTAAPGLGPLSSGLGLSDQRGDPGAAAVRDHAPARVDLDGAATTHRDALAVVPASLWREIRRYSPPIQLALAAGHAVVARVGAPADAALIALAPCHSGSPELHRWVREIAAGGARRMNPTHTLHAVDNLALSAFALALANHAWGMSLGGAPGMGWTALELVGERFATGDEQEAIVLGGDQLSGREVSPAAGIAIVFARERTAYAGRYLRLLGVERSPIAAPCTVTPHAAHGLIAMTQALGAARPGPFTYAVPPADGDGIDALSIAWEVAE
jgi:hypothetical protein